MPAKRSRRAKATPAKSKGRNSNAVPIAIVIVAALALYVLIYVSNAPVQNMVPSNGTLVTTAAPLAPRPALNITLNVTNDEVTGRYGYWALANYTRTIKAYQEQNGSYILSIMLRGTWTTFAGAVSPTSNTTIEAINASGPFEITYTASPGNATLNSSADLNGFIGTFNANGTSTDIMKQMYADQRGPPDSFGWSQRYFGTNAIQILDYMGVFGYQNQTYSVIFNGTYANVTGNIAT